MSVSGCTSFLPISGDEQTEETIESPMLLLKINTEDITDVRGANYLVLSKEQAIEMRKKINKQLRQLK